MSNPAELLNRLLENNKGKTAPKGGNHLNKQWEGQQQVLLSQELSVTRFCDNQEEHKR